MTEQHLLAHRIASKAAKQLVIECAEAGLEWSTMTVACETIITIVVAAAAEMSQTPDKVRFSSEIIEMMTQAAHKRVVAYIRGKPYAG